MSGVEVNKAYFNKEAATYGQKHEKTIDQLVEEIQARLDFIGVDWVEDEDDDDDDAQPGSEAATPKRSVRFLDYACGTGLLSRALGPYVTECRGADLSENMVEAYNSRARNQGLTEKEMHAVQGNLLDPADPHPESLSSPDLFNFDLAAVGLGFHHFDDPPLAASRLAERLKPGGVLMIIDFLPHQEMSDDHPAKSTVRHHGFSEEAIKDMFEAAGVGKDFKTDVIANVIFPGHSEQMKRGLFIARGVKG